MTTQAETQGPAYLPLVLRVCMVVLQGDLQLVVGVRVRPGVLLLEPLHEQPPSMLILGLPDHCTKMISPMPSCLLACARPIPYEWPTHSTHLHSFSAARGTQLPQLQRALPSSNCRGSTLLRAQAQLLAFLFFKPQGAASWQGPAQVDEWAVMLKLGVLMLSHNGQGESTYDLKCQI